MVIQPAVNYENDGADDVALAFAEILAVAKAKARRNTEPPFRAGELAGWAGSSLALREALEEAGCTEPTNSAKTGYWLRALKNRIAGGLRLQCEQVKGGRLAAQWTLVAVAADGKTAQKISKGVGDGGDEG